MWLHDAFPDMQIPIASVRCQPALVRQPPAIVKDQAKRYRTLRTVVVSCHCMSTVCKAADHDDFETRPIL
jgi:hypothetical protein